MSKMNIRCYDNGGESVDRYTVLDLNDIWSTTPDGPIYGAWACSDNPFHPLGFGQHTSSMDGLHLGKKVDFDQLPEDVKQFVLQDFEQ